jgi:tRNA(Ile)-lysidine synthase
VLARTAMLAQSEEDYWAELISELFREFARMSRFGLLGDLHFLRQQHPAVQRRLIRKALGEIKGDLRSLDSTHVEAVLRMCSGLDGHDRVMVPGVDVLRSFHQLRFARPAMGSIQHRHYRLPLQLGAYIELPFGAGMVRLDPLEGHSPNDRICANFKDERGFRESATLAWGVLGGPAQLTDLAIRNWEPGDAYRRRGHHSTAKLKTLFQEHKVPLWERRHWPVLEFHDEIVWTRQFGASARFGCSDDDSPALLLRYWTAHESNGPLLTSTD